MTIISKVQNVKMSILVKSYQLYLYSTYILSGMAYILTTTSYQLPPKSDTSSWGQSQQAKQKQHFL